jgi:hypothetical protein
MAYVYRHIRLDKNEPFYIGISNSETYERAHTKGHRNNMWHKIINKTEYRVDIILDGLTYKEAKEKEAEFISLYGRINTKTGILCNMTDGGDGTVGYVFEEETREKIRKANTGWKPTEEMLKKMSKARKGKKLSKEHRENLSKACMGRYLSDEIKNKISESKTGVKIGGKLVLDLETGVYYDSLKEACEYKGIKLSSSIYSQLNDNLTKVKNKTSLIYAN